jgi:hypothetical protein
MDGNDDPQGATRVHRLVEASHRTAVGTALRGPHRGRGLAPPAGARLNDLAAGGFTILGALIAWVVSKDPPTPVIQVNVPPQKAPAQPWPDDCHTSAAPVIAFPARVG